MDKDGSLNISYGEWRDFLLLAPSTDILGLIKFWRHSTVSTKANQHCSMTYLTKRNCDDSTNKTAHVI